MNKPDVKPVRGASPGSPEALAASLGTDGATPTVDEIHDQLREWILHGELEAGSVISQVKLAERLSVNRTPLREALRMLQREGLVHAEYNRRIRIAPLRTAEFEQIYAIRVLQEALGIRLGVPRFSSVDLQRMAELIEEMESLASSDNFEQWEQPHRQFHRLLVSQAGERLRDSLAMLQDHTERYRRALIIQSPVALEHGAVDHRNIAAACAARDATAAGAWVARHLSRTALALISISEPTYDAVAIRESLRMVVGDDAPPEPIAGP